MNTIAAATAAVAIGVGVNGCGSSASQPSLAPADHTQRTCQPPLPTLSAGAVTPGSSVTISDLGLRCQPHFAGSQTLTVSLYPPNRRGGHPDRDRAEQVATDRVGPTARFRVALTIPQDVKPGRAVLAVNGHQLDERLRCAPNAVCGTFGVSLTIAPQRS